MQAGLISGPELGHCAVLLAVILKAPEPQTPFTSSWLQGARLEGSMLLQLGLPGAQESLRSGRKLKLTFHTHPTWSQTLNGDRLSLLWAWEFGDAG